MDMSGVNKFDDNLFEILKECKTLPTFLDVIFGFLNRRTDFYLVAEDSKASKVGLPPGIAEGLVRHTFHKWVPKGNEENEQVETKAALKKPVEVDHKSFTSSDCYNGAVYENYSWSQSISDVDVTVNIPNNITTKQLDVVIELKKLAVKLKKDNTPILEGELCHKIKHTEAIWSIDKSKLEIHLDKSAEIWWNCLVTTETKLDINKLDCSRPYEELSDEAQAKIEELTWNQEQKRLGLPTSDQISLENTLKKAWNVDGSPFSGPFDPSSVIMN